MAIGCMPAVEPTGRMFEGTGMELSEVEQWGLELLRLRHKKKSIGGNFCCDSF